MKRLSPAKLNTFIQDVWAHYEQHGRSMPWRNTTSPYPIVVSEIMLQQTQVHRIMQRFPLWMKRFPDWRSLAQASTSDILREWSGLGYNRRALYLKRIAEIVTKDPKFSFLKTGKIESRSLKSPDAIITKLQELPGIGPNTAGSIAAFSFNLPVPFIETNIRSVFIHGFFANTKNKIHDNSLRPLLEKCLTEKSVRSKARQWYWALMDYGTYLKSFTANPSRKSTHHIRQKPFKGSNRELRSKILKLLLTQPASVKTLSLKLPEYELIQITKNIEDLKNEGFLIRTSRKSQSIYQII